jgi:hypothetical protein
MIYECTRCHKFFSKKYNYEIHIRRKIPCKETIIFKVNHDQDNINESSETTTSSSQKHSSILLQSSTLTTSTKIDVYFNNSKTNGYKCLICNLVYKFSQSLSSHKRKKHPNYDLELNELEKKNR